MKYLNERTFLAATIIIFVYAAILGINNKEPLYITIIDLLIAIGCYFILRYKLKEKYNNYFNEQNKI